MGWWVSQLCWFFSFVRFHVPDGKTNIGGQRDLSGNKQDAINWVEWSVDPSLNMWAGVALEKFLETNAAPAPPNHISIGSAQEISYLTPQVSSFFANGQIIPQLLDGGESLRIDETVLSK